MNYDQVIQKILQGDIRTGSRLMRDVDDEIAHTREILKKIYPYVGKAYRVGITGNPGAGKSTVTDLLISHYRKQGLKVGVIAIDPTSPYSGGAILGDRIRMQRHFNDEGVFIRSLATRGNLGGITHSTQEIVNILDAMGYDVILVETVGVGQDEIDIVKTVHTSIVLVVPGLGDEIQAIKAGIFEIADIFVLNKCDREGADKTYMEIQTTLDFRPDQSVKPPEIIRMVGLTGEGLDKLIQAIDEHRKAVFSDNPNRFQEFLRKQKEMEIVDQVKRTLFERVTQKYLRINDLEEYVDAIIAKKTDPYSITDHIIQKIFPPDSK